MTSADVHIPLAEGTKSPPLLAGWTADPPPPMTIGPNHNIGKRLDDDVDVDLDCLEARLARNVFLPETRMHGRPSTGVTHCWYYAKGAICETFVDVVKTIGDDGKEKYQTLVEIRTGNDHYTVIPPSRVPVKNNGQLETLRWYDDREARTCEFADLRTSVVYVAITALIARHFIPDGERWKFYEALAGFMLGTLHIPADDAVRILDTVAEIVKDTDTNPRT